MPLVNLSTVLKEAQEKKYAVGSFNLINLDFLQAIVRAAEKKRSPVILSIAEVHLKYVYLDVICPAIKAMADRSMIPMVLHLDHAESFDVIMHALRNGFTSIMFDGSKLDYDENVSKTKEIVRLCHAVNVSVEAELGAVGGAEGGELAGRADPALFTDPEQAYDFVSSTGINALAVAIGNVHGRYKGKPQLDFDRLEKIKGYTDIPIVLHGGSGISDEEFRKLISLGISKINFFTGMAQAALETVKEELLVMGEKYNDYPELLLSARKRIQQVVEEQMSVFGSENRI